MTKHLIAIDSATGDVLGEWESGAAVPEAVAGRTWVDVTGQGHVLGTLSMARWDGATFVDAAAPVNAATVSLLAFVDRLTPAELTTMVVSTSPAVRAYWERAKIAGAVDVTSPALVSALTALFEDVALAGTKNVGARVAAIVSNTAP